LACVSFFTLNTRRHDNKQEPGEEYSGASFHYHLIPRNFRILLLENPPLKGSHQPGIAIDGGCFELEFGV
jgi:hypothetical protein